MEIWKFPFFHFPQKGKNRKYEKTYFANIKTSFKTKKHLKNNFWKLLYFYILIKKFKHIFPIFRVPTEFF